jgi:hypothetical protein
MSRNKLFFQVRTVHVLRFISICDLFTDSPSLSVSRRLDLLPICTPRTSPLLSGSHGGAYIEVTGFCNVPSCTLVGSYQHFEGTCLHGTRLFYTMTMNALSSPTYQTSQRHKPLNRSSGFVRKKKRRGPDYWYNRRSPRRPSPQVTRCNRAAVTKSGSSGYAR